ncbi:mechanosensitive ion channel [Ramlibacter sp. G-1-2-2]|uniref:Mechanosensitive ion channel n=1 Tax=Ramlibacter agri TaxID=2728837 RepID=A0A848H6A9_9BURK|nr:mechanosensitive ion channel domain-containing protein [Ramlibacter agri]NML46496.1 mechanosensitive ion channel [Ramlibacter agri]
MNLRLAHRAFLRGLAAGLLLAAVPVRPAEPPAAAPAATAARKPITIAEIIPRADSDQRQAERVASEFAAQDPAERLQPSLDAIAASVDDKLRAFPPGDLVRLPVRRLESLERHWRFDARRFDRWQGEMRDATQPLLDDAADIARRRMDWEATRAAVGLDGLPAALATRVDAMIARLQQVERGLSQPLERVIALRQQANALDARIVAGRRQVADAIQDIDRRLLRLDAPPLWRAYQPGAGGTDAAASLAEGLEIETRFLRDYALADGIRLARALELLLLPLVLFLAARGRRALEPVDVELSAARALARPVSLWLLLVVTAVLAFEPDAPLMAQQLAMLLAAIPVLRLLPPASQRELGPWPYVASGLFLLNRLGFLVMSSTLLYRVYVLGLAVLALVLMLWLLLRLQHAMNAGKAGTMARGLRVGGLASVGLLVASIASNVAGNLSLAEMLVDGVVDSGYLALMAHVGVAVCVVLLQLLMNRSRWSRRRLLRPDAPPLERLLVRVVKVAALAGWAAYAMNSFRVFRPAYGAASELLSYELTLGEISLSLGRVCVFFLAVFLSVGAARLVRLLLRDEMLPRLEVPQGVGSSVASLAYYAMLLLGFVLALSAAGFRVSQLALVFGALGVGIGFGLQALVNNFVSGLVLMVERPLRVGDVVEMGGITGEVRTIGLRATVLRTFDGADVVVPNGSLLSGNLTNWTLVDRRRRVEVNVGLEYGCEPARAIELLLATAGATPGIAAQPAPQVLFQGLGANSLDFVVRAWCEDFDASATTRSALVTRIHDAVTAAGLRFPFPQRDLNLRSVSPEAEAVLRPQPPR